MISFLTSHRRHAVELWSLMRRSQHQLSSKLAEYVLSEFSSDPSSSDSGPDREKQFPGIYLFEKGQIEIESLILKEENQVNRRLINIFQQKDKERTHKWYLKNKEKAVEQSIRALKVAIARNLVKTRT